MERKLKIFDTTWHIPHQYDMAHALKDQCDFFLCLNTKRQWDSIAAKEVRPIPDNVCFVTHYSRGDYDVALLHIDQQAISPSHQKRKMYIEFDRQITDIPKVVINHGTPVYPEGFLNPDLSDKDMHDYCNYAMQQLIGDNTMVVNSYTAATRAEWGFGIPIIHGINPNVWLDLPKEPRVFTAVSAFGLDAYYNRDCLRVTEQILSNKYGYVLWQAKKNVPTQRSLDTYKEYLGASLLYLDTSIRTPMNRSRTEAFLSGCCVLQCAGAHDLKKWAKHNENIVLVPNDPEEIAKTIVDFLEHNYSKAIAIGQCGKSMARKQFSIEKYRKKWLNLFDQLI